MDRSVMKEIAEKLGINLNEQRELTAEEIKAIKKELSVRMSKEIEDKIKNGEIGVKFANYGQERETNIKPEAEEVIERIAEVVEKYVDKSTLKITRRSNDYLTIAIKGTEYDGDVVRIQNSGKWISIAVSPENRKKYAESDWFTDQKDKNQIMWKTKIKNLDDINKYEYFLVNGYNWVNSTM